MPVAGNVAAWIPTLEVEFAVCSPRMSGPPSGLGFLSAGSVETGNGREMDAQRNAVKVHRNRKHSYQHPGGWGGGALPNACGQQGAAPIDRPMIAIGVTRPVIGG